MRTSTVPIVSNYRLHKLHDVETSDTLDDIAARSLRPAADRSALDTNHQADTVGVVWRR